MGLATSDQSRADRSDQFFIKCTAFFEWHHGETGKENEEDEEGKGILGHHRTRQSVQVVLSFFLYELGIRLQREKEKEKEAV